ncbi:WYL domain-containing protein [Lactobacillus salsicarnum]|uniref:WYL domain-containing protein n=2 Tax=Companilactobacillus mishanensis TaxID=2486008 RepID=A0ABW9P9F0_9LACO|nr:WYL domain-containing protein [Companilactobacillus mishanensis]
MIYFWYCISRRNKMFEPTKLERMLTMVLILLSKKEVSSMHLINYADTTDDELRETVGFLRKAGLHIDRHHSTEISYRLDTPLYNNRKFLTLNNFLAIKHLAEGNNDTLNENELRSFIISILYNDFSANTQRLESEESHIMAEPTDARYSAKIYNAIEKNELLEIQYEDVEGQRTRRRIEPMEIYFQGGCWYVWAYCLKRKDLRNFRVDRIVGLTETGEIFIRRPFEMVESEKTASSYKVSLKFDLSMKHIVMQDFIDDNPTVVKDGVLVLEKDFYNEEFAMASIIKYGNKVHIEAPKQLIAELLQRITEIQNLYK